MERRQNNEQEALSIYFDHMVDAGRKALRAKRENVGNYGLLFMSAVSLGEYFRTKPDEYQDRVLHEKLEKMSQVDERGELVDGEGIDAVRFVLSHVDQESTDKRLSSEQGREVATVVLSKELL